MVRYILVKVHLMFEGAQYTYHVIGSVLNSIQYLM